MRFFVFFDQSGEYLLDSLNTSVSHVIIGGFSTSRNNITSITDEHFLSLNNTEQYAIVLAIADNLLLERVLFLLRKNNVKKMIYIVRLYTLNKKLPFMRKEQILRDRVDCVEFTDNGGGGVTYLI